MTFLLAVSTLLSKLLGVIRNNRFADAFGAGDVTDAYYAAFQIPDLIYGLIVLGAISAAFVPIFLKIRKQSTEEAWKFANTILNSFTLAVIVAGMLILLFAGPIVDLLYSGFSDETKLETVKLLRIMILSPILFATSSIWGGIQNSYRTFWGYALAPIVYNLSIIFGIVYLSEPYGIEGVAYGVVIGALLHSLVQVVPVIRLGFRWRPVIEWTSECTRLVRLGVPRILTLGIYQINLMVEAVIAAGLAVGGLTVYRYAQDIQYLPLGIVGISVAVSSFSVMSDMAADGAHGRLSEYLRRKVDQILILVIPSAIGLFVLREQVVHLILNSGEFTVEAAMATKAALAVLCFGLLGGSLTPLFSRVYYSFQNTKIPLVIGVATVLVNGVLAYLFSRTMGVVGIALASSVTMTAQLILLTVMIRRRFLGKHGFWDLRKTMLFVIAGLVMGVAVWYSRQWFDWEEGGVVYLMKTVAVIAVGVLIYGVGMMVGLRSGIRGVWAVVRD